MDRVYKNGWMRQKQICNQARKEESFCESQIGSSGELTSLAA